MLVFHMMIHIMRIVKALSINSTRKVWLICILSLFFMIINLIIIIESYITFGAFTKSIIINVIRSKFFYFTSILKSTIFWCFK